MALAERRTLAIEAKLRDLLSAPLTKMERNMSRFGVLVSRSLGVASLAIGTITTGALIGFRSLLRVAEGLDVIAKASDNLGITAESLTAIRNGAALAGVSIEELGAAMKQFQKVVDEANEGGKQQRETLERLGLSARDFSDDQLDVVDVLARVADGLKGVDSAAARTRILVDLFGRSGQQLGALLKNGSVGIRELAAEAEKLGIVFSREQLQQTEDFIDSFDKLKQTLRGLAEVVVIHVSPAFTEFFDTLRKAIVDKGAEIGIQLRTLVSIIIDGLELLTQAVRRMLQIVEGFNSILQFANLVRLAVVNAFHDISGNAAAMERTQTEIANAKARFLELVEVLRALDNAGDSTSKAFADLRKKVSELVRAGGAAGTLPTVFATEPDKQPDPTVWEKYWAGFNEGAAEAKKRWTDFETAGKEAAKTIIDSGLNELVNVLGEVGRTINSLSEFVEQFARAFIADLQKIIAKLLVMQALQALGFRAEEGGVLPAMERGGIKRYAGGGVNRNGGVARRPTVLFGEGATAEAFVPLPDNRSIPVSFVGGGPGGGTMFNFYITAMDSKDVQRVLVEEQNTLRAIWQNQVETRVGTRRTIQRVR